MHTFILLWSLQLSPRATWSSEFLGDWEERDERWETGCERREGRDRKGKRGTGQKTKLQLRFGWFFWTGQGVREQPDKNQNEDWTIVLEGLDLTWDWLDKRFIKDLTRWRSREVRGHEMTRGQKWLDMRTKPEMTEYLDMTITYILILL